MKNTFFGIVIIILCIIAATQRGCLGTLDKKGPDTVRVVDTAWYKHDSIIVKKVPVYKEIPADIPHLPQPPSDYESLKTEFSNLRAAHYSKRIYKDSIPVGKFGYIHVTDTVSQNSLLKRKTEEKFSIPVVKETVTITKYPDPKGQLYIGGGVNAQSVNKVLGAETGIMYKTKKDQMIGAKFNVNVDGTTSFGITYYTKIQLKKK